jgi:hypothetical protein
LLLVDDRLVLRAVVGTLPPGLRGRPLATTTTWWWRATSAMHGGRGGALSAEVADAELDAVAHVLEDLDQVLTVLDIRSLMPLMGHVAGHHAVNLLAAEAVAAALTLDCGITLATAAPPLLAAANGYGVEVVQLAL